jgi:hypothetical protein
MFRRKKLSFTIRYQLIQNSNSPAGWRGSERVEVTSCGMTSNTWGGLGLLMRIMSHSFLSAMTSKLFNNSS